MNPAAWSTGSQPGDSSASTDESAGLLTPPSSASTGDDASVGDGGGGYADSGDDSHDGLPSLSIPPLAFPDMIEIPGVEPPNMDRDVSPASPASPMATTENDNPISAAGTRTPSEPPTSTPSPEGSNQRLAPDGPDASQTTACYTVMPKNGKDEARVAAAFLRILSLVPLRNVVGVHEIKGFMMWWDVIMTKDQALELLADPSIGAVMSPHGYHYDPTDC